MRFTCPTCGPSAQDRFYAQRAGHVLHRCGSCGLIFLKEQAASVNNSFFADATRTISGLDSGGDAIEYWSYPQFYEKYQDVFTAFFKDRWEKITRANGRIESLLDIGCGYGFFMDFVSRYVPLVRGIDLNDEVARYAREVKGLAVDQCPVEEYAPQRRFDCIVICDVLEHVAEPELVLAACLDLLAEGGVLFVQVPNVTGFRLPAGHSWGLPHHIWQFSPGSLRRLVEKSGFTVTDWYTGVLGVIGAYERGGPSVWERCQWAAARYMKLGNRLQMVCRNQ